MNRPLRILFATAHPHLPQIAGGLQASTDETMQRLAALGHDVRLLCGLTGAGALGLRHRIALKLGRGNVVRDRHAGYGVFRAWHPPDPAIVSEVLHQFPAEVMLAQGGGAAKLVRSFDAAGVPGAIYFRNVEFGELRQLLPELHPDTAYISNSQFTRSRARAALGVDSSVIYPLIDLDRYRVSPSGDAVLFVNPHPSKGAELACEIARLCPDIPFLFVEAWTLAGPENDAIRETIRALPNVTLLPRAADMAPRYARARLLLAPSQWEEAFGRVVIEAQSSGIPALASGIGGLPEAVGQGGALLPARAPVQHWVAALRAIWDDPAEHARLAAAARAHVARIMDPDSQIRSIESVLLDRVARAVPRSATVTPLRNADRTVHVGT